MARPGPSYGPHYIREASQQYQGGYHSEFQVDLFETLGLADCGDVAVVPIREKTFDRTERCVSEIYRAGAFPIVFGGDDSITIAVARSIAPLIEGRMGYIHIDAHSDTWDEVAGEKVWAGASVNRIAELPNVDTRNIAMVGLNGPLAAPRDFADYVARHGIYVATIWDIDELGVEKVIERVLETAWRGTEGVLLHTDLDSMDQGYISDSSGSETGGLSPREVLKMVRAFVREGVEAYVIPECSPAQDRGNHAARVAVRLAVDALAIRANPNGTGRVWSGT